MHITIYQGIKHTHLTKTDRSPCLGARGGRNLPEGHSFAQGWKLCSIHFKGNGLCESKGCVVDSVREYKRLYMNGTCLTPLSVAD